MSSPTPDADIAAASTAPITITSLDYHQTRLPPSGPLDYLRYLIITTLRRKGFDGAQSGAIAEIEKLLEHHVQRLFESASQHATYAGRASPTPVDALVAQDEAFEAKRLKRESKKRRIGESTSIARISLLIHPASTPVAGPFASDLPCRPLSKEAAADAPAIPLTAAPRPSSPPPRTTLDLLVDFASDEQKRDHAPQGSGSLDRKPTLEDRQRGGPSRQSIEARKVRMGQVPSYAFDWAPGLPGKWMYETQPINDPPPIPEVEPAPKVTSASMDFVKSTTVVGENIPPELGIVHFLKTGDRHKRRRVGLETVDGRA